MLKKMIDWFNRVGSVAFPETCTKYRDPYRPDLVFTAPPGHVYLCSYEISQQRKEYDKKRNSKNVISIADD